jgi:hypothetical protein
MKFFSGFPKHFLSKTFFTEYWIDIKYQPWRKRKSSEVDDQWYTVKVLFFAYFDEDVGQRKIVPSKNGTLSNVKNHSVRQSVKSDCKGETDN